MEGHLFKPFCQGNSGLFVASVSEELWTEEGEASEWPSKGRDKQWSMVGKEKCYSLLSHFPQHDGADHPFPGTLCNAGTWATL